MRRNEEEVAPVGSSVEEAVSDEGGTQQADLDAEADGGLAPPREGGTTSKKVEASSDTDMEDVPLAQWVMRLPKTQA